MASPLSAASAYAKLARLAADPSGALAMPKPGGPASAAPDFGTLVKEAIGSVVEAGRKSDAQAKAMAAGKANLVDVVTAVSETEVAIETLVSVRDKVIQAYEEIMKMPI
ncbi:MAG: flagellar hook-basal body complex protein FliE [Hyphomicrobiales bacterium]|jgi:flagellar hook-basal body complex protein FliE|nr:flagellar hook-basal body complex protein FliE [Hyphomicrobiales bacterium]